MTKDYVINPDRFKNFFNELDTRRTLVTTVTDLNNKLFTHFNSLEETLTERSRTLDTQIQKFKEDTEQTLESLRIRESVIPEKEVTLAARVQQLKDSGIADIEKGSNSDAKGKTMSDVLRMWFRRMDCKGLTAYLVANRKRFVELRAETATAAAEAVDLLGFVLEAVEEFVELKVSGKKVGGGLAQTRCACGILIQAAFPIPSGSGPPSSADGGVSTRWKERAATVLEKWKAVLSCDGDDGVSSGEAIMFLTIVVGFGLKDRFEDEFLGSLVLEVGSRRDMAKLAAALRSGDQIRDMIEELAKTGKELEAVYIASEAGLCDVFPRVELLKSRLKNCRKTASEPPSREDVNNEWNVSKAIIKCIEDHKLESEFGTSGLRKRIAQLEKMKADKKRTAGGGGSGSGGGGSNKRQHSHPHPHPHPRRFGGGTSSSSSFRAPKSSRVSNISSGFHHRNYPPPPTHPPSAAARYAAPYGYSSPAGDSYGVGYGAVHGQAPAGYVQYVNPNQPMQDVGAIASQGNYSSYDYVAAAAASEHTYPTTYNP